MWAIFHALILIVPSPVFFCGMWFDPVSHYNHQNDVITNASHLICYTLNKTPTKSLSVTTANAWKIEGMKSLLPFTYICLTLFHHHVKTCSILYEYWSVLLCWWYSRVALDNRRAAIDDISLSRYFGKPVCRLIYLSIVANDPWLGSMAWFPATFTMLATYRSLLTLRWRHNGHDGVSNHQPHHWLLNRLFGYRSKKTPKLRVIGRFVGNSPGTGEFPAQLVSNAENISIWWRHHGLASHKPSLPMNSWWRL